MEWMRMVAGEEDAEEDAGVSRCDEGEARWMPDNETVEA